MRANCSSYSISFSCSQVIQYDLWVRQKSQNPSRHTFIRLLPWKSKKNNPFVLTIPVSYNLSPAFLLCWTCQFAYPACHHPCCRSTRFEFLWLMDIFFPPWLFLFGVTCLFSEKKSFFGLYYLSVVQEEFITWWKQIWIFFVKVLFLCLLRPSRYNLKLNNEEV